MSWLPWRAAAAAHWSLHRASCRRRCPRRCRRPAEQPASPGVPGTSWRPVPRSGMEHVQSKEPRSAAEHRQRWSTSIAGRSRRSAKTERSEGTINRAEATIQSTPAPTSEPVFHTVALTAPGALATATSTSPADACSRSPRRVKEPHGRPCCTVGCCSSCTHRRALPD